MKKLVLCVLLLCLYGCETTQKQPPKEVIKVKVVKERVEVIHPTSPVGVMSPSIEFKIVTPDVTNKLNDDIAKGAEPYVYFAMDETNYLELAKWLQDLLRYIKEQNEVIDYYRSVTSDPK
jgi:hypothetical protein